MRKKIKIPLRLQLTLPVGLAIVIVIVFLSIWYYQISLQKYADNLRDNLVQRTNLLDIFFQREFKLRQKEVLSKSKLFYQIFQHADVQWTNNQFVTTVENQYTHQEQIVQLNDWKIDGRRLWKDTTFLDSLQNLLQGTLTIFQRTDLGFVRFATTIKKNNRDRAVGTYIPLSDTVSQTILQKNWYTGRAYVVNDWYYTAYIPLLKKDSVIGMLYYGIHEKDIKELLPFLQEFRFGYTGHLTICDSNDSVLFSTSQTPFCFHTNIQKIKHADSIIFTQFFPDNMVCYKYIQPFDLFVFFTVQPSIELQAFKQKAQQGILLVSAFVIVFLLSFLYYFTTDRLYRFAKQIQEKGKIISSISKALEDSEDRFRTLFFSTGDAIFVTDSDENIVEVNDAACEELEYSREELLHKKITEIKTERYKSKVAENRRIIYEKGFHQFESEHVTKSGKILKVEFTSRLINYKGKKLILSIVRNITDRLELERKLLSATILGEEKERQRIAREMHDGLGPLLSALKLYINELSGQLTQQEKEDLLQHVNEIVDEAIQSIRNISNNLIPTTIKDYGLIKTLQHFCEKINKTNQINIHFETEMHGMKLDQELELILYRIVTELITNSIKHAKADNIFILLIEHGNKIKLYYKDDGVGFDIHHVLTDNNKGLGLKNILSRVKSINAQYTISSSPGNGFTFSMELDM